MSIIHDALKKLQESTRVNEPKPVLASSPPNEANRPIFAVLTLIISIAVMILLAILWNLARETDRPAPTAVFTTDQSMLDQKDPPPPVPEPAPQPAGPKFPSPKELGSTLISPQAAKTAEPTDPLLSIRIQGVMQKDGRTVVLINDNIYAEGQTIFGRIIVRITPDSLTIMDGGKQRVFPVKPSAE